MSDKLSKSQIDQLGERIKGSKISESDLQLLDMYRRSFAQAYEYVVRLIRDDLNLQPTGRPTKSTTSITYKLARESLRLSQMQDIAGCRIVVENVLAQDDAVDRIKQLLEVKTVFDRREAPSSGYRAMIVRHLGLPIEIQVRTALQHVWAELSEKLSDVVDPSVKYGGGSENLVDFLKKTSELGALIERAEKNVTALGSSTGTDDEANQEVAELGAWVSTSKLRLAKLLRSNIKDAHMWRSE